MKNIRLVRWIKRITNDDDIIFVVDDGKVITSGKHSNLLKTCDIYKNLYVEESLNSMDSII